MLGSVGLRALRGCSPLLSTSHGTCRALAASSKPKVSTALVKELREASGAPVVDCMKALSAEGVDGDISKAFSWLRKRGVAKASSMASRSANEGLIGVATDPSSTLAVAVEVASETDFVARNARFQALVSDAAATALAAARADAAATVSVRTLDVDALLSAAVPGRADGATLRDAVADAVGAIRENITVRRATCVRAREHGGGVVAAYVHGAVADGQGRAAALVALECEGGGGGGEELSAAARGLAMHCVAARPRFLAAATVPADELEKERAILMEQVKDSGKPPAIVAKMVDGRMGKFYAEATLLGQPHMVEEGNPKVEAWLGTLSQRLGGRVSAAGFARFAIGDEGAQS